MPENRPFESGKQQPFPPEKPSKAASQPPNFSSQRAESGSPYHRFVDEQMRAQRPQPPRQPFVPAYTQKPLPSLEAQSTVLLPSGSAPQPTQQRGRSGCLRVVLIVLLVLLLVVGGVVAYLYFTFSGPLSQIVGQRASCGGGAGSNADQGRINILLLGSDNDQKFQGQPLAQTDIVVTINPAANTVGMLSIPRDFFLNVPGHGMHKLDEAYSLGGVSLSCLTIEQDFGIPLNYYAWVGLDGFINVINTVGGVDVNVTHAIVDDNYPNDVNNPNDPYALERLYLAPGPQHLNGQQALEYVRSRHADLVGDFGRSARQQQVLLSLKGKLDNSDVVSKLSTIANELKGSVKTDMQLTEVLKVVNFAKGLNISAIQRVVLGPPYSAQGVAPDDSGIDAGQSVVIPNCPQVITAVQKLFQLGDQAVCNIQGGPGTTLRDGSPQNVVAAAAKRTVPLPASTVGGGNEVGNATASLLDGPSGLFGVRSVLDVMFLAVFEAPNVLQV